MDFGKWLNGWWLDLRSTRSQTGQMNNFDILLVFFVSDFICMTCFQVWNLENLQCLQTLTDHADVVMSVLCWDQFLLSCSLDKTIKVLTP